MTDIKEVKKWDYEVIFDNTSEVFKTFNEIYDKNREAARYFILNKKLSSTRIVVFIKKHINIIVEEEVSWCVSIALKRYKSTKTISKFYVDTKTGAISKSVKGKFIYCKISEVKDDKIKNYIISKMKWIGFVFNLHLPITFNTIVTKKLYSQRKLLTWYWGTNYPTALKLQQYNKNGNDVFFLRKHMKNIKNINNINPEFFSDHKFATLFFNTLQLAIKSRTIINAAWSFKRLLLEYKKKSRLILDTLYDNYDKELKISEKFTPILHLIKKEGFIYPKTLREVSKLSNDEIIVNQFMATLMYGEHLLIKKDGVLAIISVSNSTQIWHNNEKDTFHLYTKHLEGSNSKEILKEIEELLVRLNKQYKTLIISDSRRRKMKKLNQHISENKPDFFEEFSF